MTELMIPKVEITLHSGMSQTELDFLRRLKGDVWKFILSLEGVPESCHRNLMSSLGSFLGRTIHSLFVEEAAVDTIGIASKVWQQMKRNIRLMFDRFCEDCELIDENFGHMGSLVNIDFPDSDLHNQAQFVAVLTLEKGRLVYKPRNLSIDAWWAEFIEVTNARSYIYCPFTVPCDGYGWVEYVEFESCQDLDAVKDVYLSYGVLLALLTFLGGNDIHHSNVKIFDSKVAPLDLETIMGYPVKPMVLHTGLIQQPLPWFALSSALQYDWSPGDTHLPMIDDEPYPLVHYDEGSPPLATEFIDYLSEGFQEGIYLLRDHTSKIRDLICSLDESIQVRFVVRNTMAYKQLWPDLMATPVDERCEFFLRESRIFSRKIDTVRLSEYHQLLRGDVPYYFMNPASCSLFGEGSEFLGFFGDQKALKAILLERLDLDDTFQSSEYHLRQSLGRTWYTTLLWSLPKPLVSLWAKVVRSGYTP